MNLFHRNKKAVAINNLPVGVFNWLRNWLPTPGTRVDYATKAGNVWDNGVVASGLARLSLMYGESPLIVQQPKKGENDATAWEEVIAHPLRLAVEQPNEYYDGSVLQAGLNLSWELDGNGYWYKLRNRAGLVVGFSWIPHLWIMPSNDRDKSGKSLVTHYLYTPPALIGKPIEIERKDIVHFRYGVDPASPAKGLSPLKAQLREVAGDNEAGNYSAAILANAGVTPYIISPKADSEEPSESEMLALRKKLDEGIKGDKRGSYAILNNAVEVLRLAFSPEQLSLSTLRRVPVERICAALQVDPMVMGFESTSKTYSNFGEALQATVRMKVMPTKRIWAQQFTQQCLVPDFGEPANRVNFDYSEVWALQEDMNALRTSVTTAYMGGVLKRSDARATLNLDVDEAADSVYYTDLSMGSAQEAAKQATVKQLIERSRRNRQANELEQIRYAD